MLHTNNNNDKIGKFTEELHQATTSTLQRTIMHYNSNCKADAIYIASACAAAAIHIISLLVSRTPDKHELSNGDDMKQEIDDANRINATTTLFSALLVHHIAPEMLANGTIPTAFGPHVLFETLEAFERCTGRKPDALLDPGMVHAARACAVGSSEALAEFLQKRTTPSPSKNLN